MIDCGEDRHGKTVVCKSAFAVLLDESRSSKLVTFIRELDDALGGGIPTSCITELCVQSTSLLASFQR